MRFIRMSWNSAQLNISRTEYGGIQLNKSCWSAKIYQFENQGLTQIWILCLDLSIIWWTKSYSIFFLLYDYTLKRRIFWSPKHKKAIGIWKKNSRGTLFVIELSKLTSKLNIIYWLVHFLTYMSKYKKVASKLRNPF